MRIELQNELELIGATEMLKNVASTLNVQSHGIKLEELIIETNLPSAVVQVAMNHEDWAHINAIGAFRELTEKLNEMEEGFREATDKTAFVQSMKQDILFILNQLQ